MPSLDITTVQPCLQHHLVPLRAHIFICSKALSSSWKFSQLSNYVSLSAANMRKQSVSKLLVRAVVTLEPNRLVQKRYRKISLQPDVDSTLSEDHPEASSEDSEEVDEREKLRRMKISKANRGNTPWNKGRKHSAETLQRIRERTKLAMQNPKVKMKLVNFGHAQSDETREKIAQGVRIGWDRRRERQMIQENCYFEWQNSIASFSRRGFSIEEELQWDSYKVLDEQYTQEWLEGIEQRKSKPKEKGNKKAPKTPEQRRKIAEAISAKWSDPDYRERVCSAMAKYHGSPDGSERKPKRKPRETTRTARVSQVKKNPSSTKSCSGSETRSVVRQLKLRRSNIPAYKDPLASSKLEMIKNIRAERATTESKKIEAIESARLLIAEAEKAANALEVAAMRSPIAQASLIESRKLIAEAIQSIQSIESMQITFDEDDRYPSISSAEEVDKDADSEKGGELEREHREVNGTEIFSLTKNKDFNFGNLSLQGIVNGSKEFLPSSSNNYSLPTFPMLKEPGEAVLNGSSKCDKNTLPNGVKVDQLDSKGNTKCLNKLIPNGSQAELTEQKVPPKPITVTKKWVCGRLVEVTEDLTKP